MNLGLYGLLQNAMEEARSPQWTQWEFTYNNGKEEIY